MADARHLHFASFPKRQVIDPFSIPAKGFITYFFLLPQFPQIPVETKKG